MWNNSDQNQASSSIKKVGHLCPTDTWKAFSKAGKHCCTRVPPNNYFARFSAWNGPKQLAQGGTSETVHRNFVHTSFPTVEHHLHLHFLGLWSYPASQLVIHTNNFLGVFSSRHLFLAVGALVPPAHSSRGSQKKVHVPNVSVWNDELTIAAFKKDNSAPKLLGASVR